MNKNILFIALLISSLTLQGMDSFTDRSKERRLPKIDNRSKISSLSDVEKMKAFQQNYRSKHNVFAQEHDASVKQEEKK